MQENKNTIVKKKKKMSKRRKKRLIKKIIALSIAISFVIFLIIAFIPKGHKIRLSKDVTEITIIKNCDISLESDYEQLVIKDKEEILSITKSFKEVSYDKIKKDINLNDYNYKYIIKTDKYCLYILTPNSFILDKGKILYCEIRSGEYDFLDELVFEIKPEEVILNFTDDDLEQIIINNDYKNINISNHKNIREIFREIHCFRSLVNGSNLLFTIELNNNKEIKVYDNNIFNYNNFYYYTLNDMFGSLLGIYNDKVITFEKNINSSSIKVSNNKGEYTYLEDTNGFIKQIKDYSYVLINNIYDFDLKLKYVINFKNGTFFNIYENNMVMINNELYSLVNNDFEFLEKIDFKNPTTGWFPWV